MAANNVYIQITAVDAASGVINQVNQGLGTMGSNATKATAQATAGMNSFNISIRQTQQIMGQLMGLFGIAGFKQLAVEMVEASDAINKVELSFRTMLGSASKAHKIMGELRDVAKDMPFSFLDLAESAQKMKAFGFEAERIPTQLQAIADAMAGMGKGRVGLDQLIVALGQMRAKGVVQGQEMYRQITEAGILADKYLIAKLKEQEGKIFTPQEVRKLVESGRLAGKVAADAIIDGMATEFKGVGAAQMDLPGVRFTKMIDEAKKLSVVVVGDLTPAFNGLLGVITKILEKMESMPEKTRKKWEFWFTPDALKIAEAAIAPGLEAARQQAEPARLDMAAKVELLRSRGQQRYPEAKGFDIPDDIFSRPIWTMEKLIVKEKELNGLWYALAKDKNDKEERLLQESTENQKHQLDIAQQALDRAEKHELEGTAAVRAGYVGLYREVKDNTVAIAKVRQAEAIESARVIREALEKTRDAYRKFNEEQMDDRARRATDTARRLSDRIGMGNNQGAEGGLMEIGQFGAFVAGATEAGKEAGNKLTSQFLGAMEDLAKRERSAIYAIGEGDMRDWIVLMKDKQILRETYNYARIKNEQETEDKIQDYRLDREKETAQRVRELEKELRDAILEERLAAIDRQADIAKAGIKSSDKDPLAKRIADTRALAQIDIDRTYAKAKQQREDLQAEVQRAEDYADAVRHSGLEDAVERANQLDLVTQALHNRNQQRRVAISKDATDKVAAYDLESADRTNDLILEAQARADEKYIAQQLRVYDQLRSVIGKVFDSMLDRGKSFWENMWEGMKTSFTRAARDIVTSRGAAMLMQLVTGQKTNMQASGDFGESLFGKIAGFLTARPVITPPPSKLDLLIEKTIDGDKFRVTVEDKSENVKAEERQTQADTVFRSTASGGGGRSGGAESVGTEILYATGDSEASATVRAFQQAGFSDPVAAVSGVASATSGIVSGASALANYPAPPAVTNTLGLVANLAAGGAGLKALMGSTGMIGSLGLGGGIAGMLAGRSVGGKLSELPAFGKPGGALIGGAIGAASGLLAFGGLAALFPALIAAGPIGWIAAAGIGAFIGMSKVLFKTATEKMREKIKQVYGVDVREKNILQAVVDIAKNKYGGNADLAVRSPEVQQIVQLYALSSGQNPTGMPRPMYAANIASSAAGLQLQPVYQNGQVVAGPYSGTTTQQWADAGIYLQLDPKQANDLFEGRVVHTIQKNPSSIAAANASALSSGSSRDAQRGAMIEPLTVMS